MKDRVDILNLEWSSYPSRDRQMVTLVCNYLRYMGYSVIEESIFNGYHYIKKYKPRLYFNASPLGAIVNTHMMKYARQKNILGVSLISEGNFKPGKKYIDQFLWGWNKEKDKHENIHMQWTERTRDMSLKYYPELKEKLKVSGGVGFDIYKIGKHKDKDDFLRKYDKTNFKKIIGIGCWDFGSFYPEDERYKINVKRLTQENINRFRKDGVEFNNILNKIISENKNILFLLKQHPGTRLGKKASAIVGTEKFENTITVKNEEAVADCINVSDFWLIYESTTAIESWLLGKQTCLLNPSGTDFLRDEIYKGSPNFSTDKKLQEAINSFYSSGIIPGFKDLEKNRKNIIKDVIQWDDGLNHVRAGNEIINLIENNKITKIKKENINYLKKRYWQMIKWYFSPYLRFLPRVKQYYHRHRIKFDYDGLKKLTEKRMKEQIEFYNKKGLDKSSLKKLKCI